MRTISLKKMLLLSSLCLFLQCSAIKQEEYATEILKISAKKFEWMINQRLDLLSNVLHEQLIYIHSNGLTESKQDVLDNISSGKLKLESVTVKEESVRVIDDLAIITGKGNFTGIIDGNSFDVELLYTEVYVAVGAKWLLLHRHANRLQ